MDHLCTYNLCHLIVRPHLYDEDKFKEHVPKIINWIFEKKSISFYSISEELGEGGHDTTGYHLDITIFSTSDIEKNIINSKGKQVGFRTILKQIILSLPNTKPNRFIKIKKEHLLNDKLYNVKKLIGYSFKEQHGELKNYNNLQISKEVIQECLQFYRDNTKKKEEVEEEELKNDVIPLSTKNAMWEMKLYIKEKLKSQQKFDYYTIKSQSSKEGYCWAGMSAKSTRTIILQLKNLYEDIEDHEIIELDTDALPKFSEDGEFEKMQQIRHPLISAYDRLTHLYENNYLTKSEYEYLTS